MSTNPQEGIAVSGAALNTRVKYLPSKRTYRCHPTGTRTEGNLGLSVTKCAVINKYPTSAINAADISEATVLNELLSLPARYSAAKIEI